MKRSPLSQSAAARCTSSRAASISVAMSASMKRDGLELGDGLPERVPVLRVGARLLERAAAQPDRQRADADAPAVQDLQRVREARVDLADALRVGHLDVLEVQLGRVASCACRACRGCARCVKPGVPFSSEERRDALPLLLRGGERQDDEDVAHRCPG